MKLEGTNTITWNIKKENRETEKTNQIKAQKSDCRTEAMGEDVLVDDHQRGEQGPMDCSRRVLEG